MAGILPALPFFYC